MAEFCSNITAMKNVFIISCVLVTGLLFFSCKKTNASLKQPSQAEGYLTASAWSFTRPSDGTRPPVFDSVAFFFSQQINSNTYRDSVAGYYPGGLIVTTSATFIVSSVADVPDTLITPFSPYSASGTRLDTFLVTDLNSQHFVMWQYTVPGNGQLLRDTLVRR